MFTWKLHSILSSFINLFRHHDVHASLKYYINLDTMIWRVLWVFEKTLSCVPWGLYVCQTWLSALLLWNNACHHSLRNALSLTGPISSSVSPVCGRQSIHAVNFELEAHVVSNSRSCLDPTGWIQPSGLHYNIQQMHNLVSEWAN